MPVEINDIILSGLDILGRFLLTHFVSKSLSACLRKCDTTGRTEISKHTFAVLSLKLKHFKLFEWTVEQNCPVANITVYETLARHGQIELMKLVCEKNTTRSVDACCAAASAGQFEALKWLDAQGFPLWGYSSGGRGDWMNAIIVASRGGHLEIVQWSHVKYGDINDCFLSICKEAALHGHLSILKWVDEIYPQRKLSTGKRSYFTTRTFEMAASCGYMPTLEWILPKISHMNSGACAEAASAGHLQVLQWLRNLDPPCPWDSTTCARAASRGHFEVFKWARQNGCPLDDIFMTDVITGDSLELLKWCIENEFVEDSLYYKEFMAELGNLDMLKWVLLEKGWEWDPRICYAGYGPSRELVEWLRENKFPFDEERIEFLSTEKKE